MTAIQHYMPRTIVEFLNKECMQYVGDNVEMFYRVFWAYKPCIDTFDHLKLLIQIDGTFLYRKYKGTLLIATSQDGDKHVVLLAFVIVEGETTEA